MNKLTLIALLAACNLDVPDLNNPGIDDLEEHPTPAKVSAAATGLLIGNRIQYADELGYVNLLGTLGRESIDFNQSDGRFISEMLEGPLNAGSVFGGAFWFLPYSNIRLANVLGHALDKVEGMTDEEKAGVRGFADTIQALDLLVVINTHDTNGEVIDTDKPVGELGAIVDRPTALAFIAQLLDQGQSELGNAGSAFSFQLSPGYAGFDTPMTFLQFNRGLRARVAIYQQDYDTALTALGASFLDDTATGDFAAGVYQAYGTSSGDSQNGLISPTIYAHPSLATDVQMKTGGMPDDRFTAKVVTAAMPGSGQDHMSTLQFTMYMSPTAPVPILRNEELILIRAEAEIGKGDIANAAADLNLIRTRSGGLPVATLNAGNIVDELLYNRRYSLLFEGGHRWIDLRRFGRITDLPLDQPTDVRNVRFPIPSDECNARPGEPACTQGSM